MTYSELKQAETQLKGFLKANKIKQNFRSSDILDGVSLTSWNLQKKIKNGILEIGICKTKYQNDISYLCTCHFTQNGRVKPFTFVLEENHTKKDQHSAMCSLILDSITNAEAFNLETAN